MADRDKFEDIALPYLDTIYRAAMALCRRAERAEDLVQSTYVKALERFESFQPGTNCRAWLLRILRNTWIDQLRHIKVVGPDVQIDQNLVAAPPPQQETAWSNANDILENFSDEQVIKALGELSEEQRLTLFLVDVEDFSHEEVGEIMDVAIGTVKSRTILRTGCLKEEAPKPRKASWLYEAKVMEHLTDQQLEQILEGTVLEPTHLDECELCRGRLSEFRVMRERLRAAFNSVHADNTLLERVRNRLNTPSSDAAAVKPGGKKAVAQVYRIFWRAGAAAAVLLLIAVPLSIYLATPETAAAAESELFQIYKHSVSPDTQLHADADPAKLAEHLKDKLGFKPAFPRLGAGMSLRGCCVTHFRNKPVGSYVVQTPRGVISLIVIKEDSKSLGLKDKLQRGDHTYMAGSYAKCEMVVSELEGYTYCAVGEVPHAFLADLLDQLVLYGQD